MKSNLVFQMSLKRLFLKMLIFLEETVASERSFQFLETEFTKSFPGQQFQLGSVVFNCVLLLMCRWMGLTIDFDGQ